MFKGKISFVSEDQKGSCFTFSFKLENALDEQEIDDKLSENSYYDIDSSNLLFKW
jgi:hypothetical protein